MQPGRPTTHATCHKHDQLPHIHIPTLTPPQVHDSHVRSRIPHQSAARRNTRPTTIPIHRAVAHVARHIDQPILQLPSRVSHAHDPFHRHRTTITCTIHPPLLLRPHGQRIHHTSAPPPALPPTRGNQPTALHTPHELRQHAPLPSIPQPAPTHTRNHQHLLQPPPPLLR